MYVYICEDGLRQSAAERPVLCVEIIVCGNHHHLNVSVWHCAKKGGSLSQKDHKERGFIESKKLLMEDGTH